MAHTLVGTADSQVHATSVFTDLKNRGYDKNVSLLYSGQKDGINEHGFYEGYDDTVFDGAVAGAAISAAPGMLASAGLVGLPVLGPVAAIGPVYGMLAGALGGGLAGALVDLGLNQKGQQQVEQWVAQGKYVLVITELEEKAANYLKKQLFAVQGIDNIAIF